MSWSVGIGVTVGFAVTNLCLERYMKMRKGVSWVPRIGRLNNIFFGIASLLMFLGCCYFAYVDDRFASFENVWCRRPPHPKMLLIHYIFQCSKLWEFFDIIFVVLMKGDVSWHFRWHHWTTFVTTSIGIATSSPLDFLAISTNTFHHFWMYLYFGGLRFLRPCLFVFGTLQLVVGVASIAATLTTRFGPDPCDGTMKGDAFVLFIYITYLVFWLNDLYSLAFRKKPTEKKET